MADANDEARDGDNPPQPSDDARLEALSTRYAETVDENREYSRNRHRYLLYILLITWAVLLQTNFQDDVDPILIKALEHVVGIDMDDGNRGLLESGILFFQALLVVRYLQVVVAFDETRQQAKNLESELQRFIPNHPSHADMTTTGFRAFSRQPYWFFYDFAIPCALVWISLGKIVISDFSKPDAIVFVNTILLAIVPIAVALYWWYVLIAKSQAAIQCSDNEPVSAREALKSIRQLGWKPWKWRSRCEEKGQLASFRASLLLGALVLLFAIAQLWFWVLASLSTLAGGLLAAFLAHRDGRRSRHIWIALCWAVVAGGIFGRLLFVALPTYGIPDWTAISSEELREADGSSVPTLQGKDLLLAPPYKGFHKIGVFIGGIFSIFLYSHRLHLYVFGGKSLRRCGERVAGRGRAFAVHIWPWLDIASLGVTLGYAIVGFGLLLEKVDYGKATTVPWGITLPDSGRVAEHVANGITSDTLIHPTWAYGSIGALVAFACLWRVYTRHRDKLLAGDIFWIFAALLSVLEFVLAGFRVGGAEGTSPGISSQQLMTTLSFLVALFVLTYRRRPGNFAKVEAAKTCIDKRERRNAENKCDGFEFVYLLSG